MSLHIASPASAKISINNLQRVMPMSGMKPVISNNDGLMIKMLGCTKHTGESIMQKQTNGNKAQRDLSIGNKGYTAEEIAGKLGISTSYVYAKLARLEAAPLRKEGKTAFYSENVINRMGGRVRRQRREIPEVVEKFKQVSKEHLGIETKAEGQPENLLDRMKHLEEKVERLEAIEKSLEEIKRILGTL